MKKQLLLLANVLVALALAYFFLQSAGLERVGDFLSRARLEFVVLGALFYSGMNLVNSFRIAWGAKRPWQPALFFKHMTSMLVSDFTPGRAGYSTIILKLRAVGVESGLAIKALGMVFASDFFSRAVLAAAAVLYFAGRVDGAVLWVTVGVMLGLGVAVLGVLVFRVKLVEKLLAWLPGIGVRLQGAYRHVISARSSPRFLAGNVALSLFGALLRGTAWMLVFWAIGGFGLEVWVPAILVSALVTALSFVPVSLAGLGLQEGAGAYLFSVALGASLELCAAAMVLIRVMEFGSNAFWGWRELLTNWRKKR
ncbi:flippase-like domain-containing protein [Candidatus Micrarchaeota archaeon]|nr:flippase-like domain-containing protein [Candidatus Micrarchaeota archaeon]